MSQNYARLISHFAVYAIGTVVLLASVFVTIIRLVLPDIGIYRGEVEAWVSNYMGYPVAIRSMDASWQGWAPNLQLTNIDLLDQSGTETVTHFSAANITVDPLATLMARRIVPRQLTLSGFDLAIERLEDGAFVIQGMELGAPAARRSGRNELADWLFRQERIRIEKGTVRWTDRLHGQDTLLLEKVALTLRSDGRRVQMEGSAALPPAYGKSMDFAFDASGNLLTAGWSGEFYLAASDINPDNWYRLYRPEGVDIAGGSADIRLWSRWAGARLASLQGIIGYRDFVARVADTALRVDFLDASFSISNTGTDSWQSAFRVHALNTEHGSWPESAISIEAEPRAGHYVASFDYIKLEDIAPLVRPLLPRGQGEWQKLRLGGELHDGTIAFGSGRLLYNVGLRGLSVQGVESLPTIRKASGRLRGDMDHARFDFRQDAITFAMPGRDAADIALSGLNGGLVWDRREAGWTLQTGGLALSSPDVRGRISGRVVDNGDGRGPFIDMFLAAGPAEATAAVRHIPLSGDSRLRAWLDRSVISGRMLSAEVLLRGHLADFPFRQREGRFAAIVSAEDVTLDYSEHWPPIDGLSGELSIDGPRLAIAIAEGHMFSSDFGNATASIADIRAAEKRLSVHGRVSGPTSDLGLFIQQSPLTGDAMLSQISRDLTGGDMDLALDLDLPLGPGDPARVNGDLTLSGARLATGPALPPLQQINGRLSFTRASAVAADISASFYGQPVTLALSGDRTRPDEPPQFIVSGHADAPFIRARIDDFVGGLASRQPEFFQRMEGSTDWRVTLSFLPPAEDGTRGKRFDLTSDLVGLAVRLPAPLGKDPATPVAFTLGRVLDSTRATDVQLRHGDVLVAGFTPRTDSAAPPAIAIEFGKPDTIPHSDMGVVVGGTLDRVPAAEWWDVIKEVKSAEERLGTRGPPLDIRADGHVRTLQLLGQQFHDVHVGATRLGDGWEFRLAGADVDGTVTVPGARDPDAPMRIDLARLKIARGEADTEQSPGETLDPRVIPPLIVKVDDLDFQGHELGTMALTSTRAPEGMRMDNVSFDKPGLDIDGTGTWLRADTGNQSHFDIHVHADRIDDMLQTFGYEVAAVRKGKTELFIDAGWDGAPSEFSWGKLNGTLRMEVSKGQLLDVDPKVGRLFGLLSFQSLPRRLSLDFTDLFGKGMAFDRIEGTFDIADGNAYTNDLHLRGPSAEVAVAGRTGLVVQDYDQVVTVTPQVTSSLPVAGALFGPVGIGIGAVLYLAGEVFSGGSDGIGDLLKYQYTVTGSWTEPVIEKIEGKDKG